jgi:hypothetical protein
MPVALSLMCALYRMDTWLGGSSDFINAMRDRLRAVALQSVRVASFTGALAWGTPRAGYSYI